MSAVSFRNVSKRFDGIEALSHLDLEIGSGEFVSLLGPSGSGKTTTLNLLAGLLSCTEGDILIGGRRVNDVPPDKRQVAMVFQNYALYPHMSVAENLAFPLLARRPRPPAAEIEAKVARVAATLGVGELLGRRPKELSGGQQQRVALGRALVRDPGVFLLDEPLSNLDARLRIRMRRDLKELHRKLGSTIIYVTHDQAEAMTLSSRVAVFDRGRLQQVGTPVEIYDRPANMFVANFLGEREMTFVRGAIEAGGGEAVFRAAGLTLPVPRPSGGARPAVLGLRVESLAPVADSGGAPVAGEVIQTELSGPDLILYVRVDPVLELCCRAESHAGFRAGDRIGLRPIPGRLLLFDPVSERALTDTD